MASQEPLSYTATAVADVLMLLVVLLIGIYKTTPRVTHNATRLSTCSYSSHRGLLARRSLYPYVNLLPPMPWPCAWC